MPVPQRLLDAMAEVTTLDGEAMQALAIAIIAWFGPCLCQTEAVIAGHRVWIELCQGHRFLMETDRGCTRIQHLQFARALREKWRLDEWGGTLLLQQALVNAGV